MPFRCATWESGDGFQRGPRPAPVIPARSLAVGGAEKFEVHGGLMHRERVAALVRLAVRGGASPVDLSRELDWALGHMGIVLRGMALGRLVQSFPACRRLGPREEGLRGDRRGHIGRVWEITPTGRWALWRQGRVTRMLLYGYREEAPLWEGLPEDPVEAVRRYVQTEWLRPMGLAVAEAILQWQPVGSGEAAGRLGVRGQDVLQRVRAWAKRGWVEDTTEVFKLYRDLMMPEWRWTESGMAALRGHVDALRLTARRCGWKPDGSKPGGGGPATCETAYEEDYVEGGEV